MDIILAILVSQLGADDFGTRERAHAALIQVGPIAHVHLHVAERSKCPEVRARARRILDPYYEANAQRWVAAHGKLPWIEGDGFMRYLDQARLKCGFCGPPEYADYREATRLMVIEMYQRRGTRAEVETLLTDLRKKERDWTAKHLRPDLPR